MNGKTRGDPRLPATREKHVWFVNHHALIPSKDGGSGRHLNMARHLPRYGWTASLVVASTIHAHGAQALKGIRLRRTTEEAEVPVLWVRATAYGRSTLRRFIGMGVFGALAVVPGMTKGLQRPDVVVGSTVHLLAAWAGWRLAKRHNVPFIYEIRDVWPDTLIHLGRLSQGNLITRAMEWLSVKLACRASLVISPLPHVDRYLEDRSVTKTDFLWVSNGFDGEREAEEPSYESGESFTFMYLGAHGNANALDGILEAFDRACARRPTADLRLRLVGAGPLKADLLDLARTLRSSERIFFEERIPQSEVIPRAREADCLVANLHNSPVYEYGISLNKLFTYLYAFRPIVLACSVPNPVQESDAGIVVAGDDRESLSDAMLEIYEAPHSRRIGYARRGYQHVLEHYSYSKLAETLGAGLDRARGRNE